MQAGVTARYEGQRLVVDHVSDETALLGANRELRKEPENGFTRLRSMRLIGQLSIVTLLRIYEKYPDTRPQCNDWRARQAAWRRALTDPEFGLYRTVERLKT